MPHPSRQAKSKPRSRDSSRQTVIVASIASALVLGGLASREYMIAKQRATAAVPSDEEIYTGSILFMPDQGPICRQLLFDNQTGRFADNGMVDCARAAYQGASGTPKQWSAARVRVISDGFRQR